MARVSASTETKRLLSELVSELFEVAFIYENTVQYNLICTLHCSLTRNTFNILPHAHAQVLIYNYIYIYIFIFILYIYMYILKIYINNSYCEL